MSASDSIQPNDIRAAAQSSRQALEPVVDADWTGSAGALDWDCRTTLEHVIFAVDRYGLYLATSAQARLPFSLVHYPECLIRDLLMLMEARAAMLAEVAVAASPTARGYHAWGRPDRSGYIAMGCVEILLHTDDIARGLGRTFVPPEDVARRAMARLFPWAPTNVDPWMGLRWATGRLSLPGHPDAPANWAWHASPLEEWDGAIKTQDDYGRVDEVMGRKSATVYHALSQRPQRDAAGCSNIERLRQSFLANLVGALSGARSD